MVDVEESAIKRRFALLWTQYEGLFAEAKTQDGETAPDKRRSERDLLDEILTLVRSLARDTAVATATANTARMNASLAITLAKANQSPSSVWVLRGDDQQVLHIEPKQPRGKKDSDAEATDSD